MSVALSHSIHTYARPETKERLLEFYTTVLGLEANAIPWNVPMYAFMFSNDTLLSVEFTADALDDEKAKGGGRPYRRTAVPVGARVAFEPAVSGAVA